MAESKSAAQAAYETLTWEELPPVAQDALATALELDAQPLPAAPESEAVFAELAYRAYVKFTGGLNYQGLPCPKWSELPQKIRDAWAAATLATRQEHDSRLDVDLDWLDGSTEELDELVAGLDALQTLGTHRQHVLVPLRARLRAALAPPQDEDDSETEDAATQSTEGEADQPETTADPSAPTDAAKAKLEPERLTPELPKVSEAPPAPELKVELPPMPQPTDAYTVVEPKAAQLEVQADPGSADAPAVGVIPDGHVQTSEEAAHTQTPDTK